MQWPANRDQVVRLPRRTQENAEWVLRGTAQPGHGAGGRPSSRTAATDIGMRGTHGGRGGRLRFSTTEASSVVAGDARRLPLRTYDATGDGDG